MDITDSEVTVYTRRKVTTTSSDTTNATKKAAIRYAKQFAYLAYMSTELRRR